MNGGVEPHLFPNLEITKIILNKDGLAEWNLFDIKVTYLLSTHKMRVWLQNVKLFWIDFVKKKKIS